MPRLLPVLGLTLLMVGCEKSSPTGDLEDSSTLASPSERRGHRPRDLSPDPPQSPREVMEKADKLESPAAHEKALADIAWNAIESDPALAHEAFQRLPTDSPERIRLIQHYAIAMAEADVEAALAWADALDSDGEIAAAKAQIALAIAETDPRRAANLLSESGVAGREFDVAVVQVIQRWSAKSVPDAAAWVITFPPGAAREASIGVIAGQWLPSDPTAAFAWFNTLQNEDLRKEAARAMEGVLLQQPSEIRDAWLQHANAINISELEQQREQALRDVGNNIPPRAE